MFSENQHIYLKKSVYIGLLAIFSYIAGYVLLWLSFQYQFHDKLVSWYFPHGIRVALLFFLPFRYWCLFLFCTIIGSDSYYHLHVHSGANIDLDMVTTFFLYYAMEVMSGAIVFILYKKYIDDVFSSKGVMGLIILSVLYRFLYLIIPAYFEFGFFSLMPQERYIEFFVAIQISGYLVGFYIIAIALLIKWLYTKNNDRWFANNTSFFINLFLVLMVTTLLFQFDPSLEYLLRIALIIPLILLAFKYGWLGGMLTSIIIVTLAFGMLFDGASDKLLAYEPFLVTYLLISMIVSVVFYENNSINQKNISANKVLKTQNKKLMDASERMQKLSQQIINIQEQERKYLSKELHDEIGQGLIVLKSSIYLLEQSDKQDFSILKQDADMIYSSVYELMHWLRPATLDKYGLSKTLEGDYFREKLALSDIEYSINMSLSQKLDDHIETTIFRICQEAVNNTLKHSDANMFTIELMLEGQVIHLILSDNGTSSNDVIAPSGGFGLNSIYERVLTLNGVCIFTQHNGFVINIKIPL